jgi:hypothetical protein
VAGDMVSRAGSSNALLVGLITRSVNGTMEKRRMPPGSQSHEAPESQARMAAKEPRRAQEACMTAVRR